MFNQRQMTGRGLDLFLDNYQWRQAHYFHSMESTETGQITGLPEKQGLKGGGEREAIEYRLLGPGPRSRASGTDRTVTGFSH